MFEGLLKHPDTVPSQYEGMTCEEMSVGKSIMLTISLSPHWAPAGLYADIVAERVSTRNFVCYDLDRGANENKTMIWE